MAHIAKFTRQSVGAILAHNCRHPDAKNPVRYQNSEIDATKSHLNYRLDSRQNPKEFFAKRLSEIKVQNRADVKVFCSWVVTVPKDLPTEKHKAFFESAFRFLESEVGAENVVVASVHMDETTPHLHFGFVPVVKEKKNVKRLGQEKCSAKELITRSYLKTFHQRLQKRLESDLQCSVGVLLPAEERDVEYNKLPQRELKKRTKTEAVKLERLEKENKIKQKELQDLQAEKEQMKEAEIQIPSPTLPETNLFERKQTFAQRALDTYREGLEPTIKALSVQAEAFKEAQEKAKEAEKRAKDAENALKQAEKKLKVLATSHRQLSQFCEFLKKRIPQHFNSLLKEFRSISENRSKNSSIER